MTRARRGAPAPAKWGWRLRPSRVPRGFTLLEVLIAVALSALLMAVVYGAFDLCGRLTSAGQDDVEQARLAQAVLREIQSDLRAAVDPRPPSAELRPRPTPGSAAFSSARPRLPPPPLASCLGDRHALVLMAPPAAGVRSDRDEAERPAVRWIGWMMSNGASVAPPANTVALPGISGWSRETVAGRGLVRAEDAAAIFPPGAARPRRADPDDLKLRLVAPEVSSLAFRYHDGRGWRDAWDSTQSGRLPRAVEVAVVVEPLRDRSARRGAAPGVPLAWRLVVLIAPSHDAPPPEHALPQLVTEGRP